MEILLRVMLVLVRIMSWLVFPIYWLLRLRKGRKVAPISNQLLFMSATTLADKIRKQEIKCKTVIEAYIDRIKEVNPSLNAVVEDRFDAALLEANEVDQHLNTAVIDVAHLELTQPLLGVPITIKETVGVQGMSQCCGSLMRVGFNAPEDGAAVARIRKAGGIILLVSNTPEFCLYWETNNKVTGCTRNPYSSLYSAGGSSGGEGALLGAGASIIGIGSDVAGSLRLPGLVNGVFAHKGSSRVVPVEGHIPPVNTEPGKNNLAIGPMVRYAQDLPLIYKVLTDNNEELAFDNDVDLNNLNVFYMHNSGSTISCISVEAEITRAINKCVEHLRHVCNCNVDQFKFDVNNSMEIAAAVFLYSTDVPNILGNPFSDKQNDWLLFEFVKNIFGCSKYSTGGLIFSFLRTFRGFVIPSRRKRYLCELEDLKIQFEEKLKTDGILLYPTFPTSAIQHNQFIFKLSGTQYLSIFNNLGLPSTHVPLGVGRNGLPIGIQVVAGPKQDRLCFAVAKELEKAFGGWSPPA